MGHGGHGGAVAAIIVLLASAWFLMWTGEKGSNPYQKVGKVVGWIAVFLSVLVVAGSLYMCAMTNVGGFGSKACPMGGMPGQGREMGPGASMGMGPHSMGSGMGMRPMAIPPTSSVSPGQPESKTK